MIILYLFSRYALYSSHLYPLYETDTFWDMAPAVVLLLLI